MKVEVRSQWQRGTGNNALTIVVIKLLACHRTFKYYYVECTRFCMEL